MSENIETSTIEEANEINETNEINEEINNSELTKRISKYSTNEERHEAIKAQKRFWYHQNKDKQKLKSLKAYYQNQLKKPDLKPEIKAKYETKLNEINERLLAAQS